MVVQGDDQMTFAILNMSGHHVTLRRNEEVGQATEIDAMMVPREEQEGEVEADLVGRMDVKGLEVSGKNVWVSE